MRNQNTSVIIAILVGVVFSIVLIFGSLPKEDAVENQPIPQGVEAVYTSTTLAPEPTPAVADEAMFVHLDGPTIISRDSVVQISDENTKPLSEDNAFEEEAEQFDVSEQMVIPEDDFSQDFDKEFQDRCRVTYAESGLEDQIGQIAVAATILNRQESSIFPDDFYDVINQSGQFSSVSNGEIYIMTSNPYIINYEDVPDVTIEATERALNGEDPTEALLWEEAERLGLDPEVYAAGGALYFCNPNAISYAEQQGRAGIQCKVQIGNHIFYKVWG